MAYGYNDDKTKVEMKTKAEMDTFITNTNNSLDDLNLDLSTLRSGKTNFLSFTANTSNPDVEMNDFWNKVTVLNDNTVFNFFGDNKFGTVVFSQNNLAWGMGIKISATRIILLTIIDNYLCYAIIRKSGTSDFYWVLNLTRNNL